MARFITYEVSGSSCFPLDMLRYDGSYPANTESVEVIQESLDSGWPEARTVKLCQPMGLGPNKQRWASFGWTVSNEQSFAG